MVSYWMMSTIAMKGVNCVSATPRYTFELKAALGQIDLVPLTVEADDVTGSCPHRETEHRLIAVT
jgi:hypothetical protein